MIAVDDGRTARTLRELVDRGERLANAFDELGIPEQATVGILAHNCTSSVEADVAIALGRRVRVALNARLHLDDFRYMAEDAQLRVLVHSPEFDEQAEALAGEFDLRTIRLDTDSPQDQLEQLIAGASPVPRQRERDPEGLAWISYTSGTTGRPKGVELSHRAIQQVALNLLLELGPVEAGERVVLTQPISHGAGYFILPYLISGGGVQVMRRFDPDEIWSLARRPELRTLKLVPSMLAPILAAEPGRGKDGWGFDSIVYGASGIAPSLLDAALDRFGATLIQDYGQSEAPVTITCLQKRDHRDPDGRLSAGRPWRSVAVEVCDDAGGVLGPGELGEVCVQGQHLMRGYHGKPAETAEVIRDGWLRTRDMAFVDDRGFVHLRGRRDEMIVTGGFNVAPREVEEVLARHRDVEDVVVLGIPDERWGQAVAAVVRPAAGTHVEDADLLAFARPRLGIRTPKRIEFWPEIPLNAYGKVDRLAIRARLDNGARDD